MTVRVCVISHSSESINTILGPIDSYLAKCNYPSGQNSACIRTAGPIQVYQHVACVSHSLLLRKDIEYYFRHRRACMNRGGASFSHNQKHSTATRLSLSVLQQCGFPRFPSLRPEKRKRLALGRSPSGDTSSPLLALQPLLRRPEIAASPVDAAHSKESVRQAGQRKIYQETIEEKSEEVRGRS